MGAFRLLMVYMKMDLALETNRKSFKIIATLPSIVEFLLVKKGQLFQPLYWLYSFDSKKDE